MKTTFTLRHSLMALLLCLLAFMGTKQVTAQINSNSQWTWVNGDNATNQLGVYGTQGMAAATNKPGARQNSVSWTDANGNQWLFGGQGYAASGSANYLNDLWKYNTSTGQWTWVSGDNTTNQLGVYGTQGTAATANKPGARQYSVSWTDASGNLWLLGGVGYAASGGTDNLNDLWKYNTSTGQWTWVSGDNTINQFGVYGIKGTAATANKPGARYSSVSWTDASGNLWLFGGNGYATSGSAGNLNDLWKYNTSTGQWTWVSGDNTTGKFGVYGTQGTAAAANKPGARYNSVSWTDASGNLWLFGGNGYTANGGGDLNDLWKYNTSTGQWTWVSGDNIANQLSVYGTKGTAAAANKPGARRFSVSWADASGNLWLLGGYGYAASGAINYLNDLWKYNISTRQWTWVSGDNTTKQLGIYGTQGTPAIANKPGARQYSVSWADASGNLWLFGGQGYAASGNAGNLNDLWKYNTSNGQWTWVNGDNTTNQLGVYGTQGTAAATNKPGARQNSVSWTDANGNQWLFGGQGYAASGGANYLNDLWKYNTSTGQWTWVGGDNTTNQLGVYGTQGTAATANKPGARQYSVSWADASGNLWLFGGVGYAASGGTDNLNDLWKYNTSTGQWTWVSGDNTINQFGVYGIKGTAATANKPGARYNSVSWTDASGNLWLFGGNGYAASGSAGNLNDLWKYNTSTGQWTWVSGDNTTGKFGVYGTQGTAAAANKPGARYNSVSWTDASGNLWLFGGNGYTANGGGDLNDLWKYNTSTGQWTWVSGDNIANQLSVYGTKGTAAAANKPGARRFSVSWADASGNLWLLGGYGYAASGAINYLNDLWKYNISTRQWTWVSGDNTTKQLGIYDTQGTPATANKPGARQYSVSWADASGNLWLFGGQGYAASGNAGNLNDLWKISPAICTPTTSTTTQTQCGGSFTWNGVTYTTTGTYTKTFTGGNSEGCDSTTTLNLTINAATTSTTNTTICSSELPYTWNGKVFTTAGSDTVNLTNAAGCDSVATLNLTIKTNYTITANAGANGVISSAGATSVCSGSDQTYTISPNTCYLTADVIVDGVLQGAVGTYTFTNVTADHTISATFQSKVPAPVLTVTPIDCSHPTASITVSPVSGITYSIDGITYGRTTWINLRPGTYTITAKNAQGCTASSTAAIVRAANSPDDYTVGGGGSVCSGGNSFVSVTLSGSTQDVSYYLMRSGIVVTGQQGNGLPLSFDDQYIDDIYSILAVDNSGCSIYMTGTARVTVLAAPVTHTVRGGGAYCGSGTGPSITLTGSQAGVNYQLYVNGTATGAPVAGTGSSIAFTNQTFAGTYTVIATATAGSCDKMMGGSATINTDVPAEPQGSVTTQTSCTVVKGAITVSPALSGLTYSVDGTTYSTRTRFTNLDPGTYTLSARNYNGCVTSSATPLTISALPQTLTQFTVTGGGSYCAKGTGVEVGLSGSETGVSYQLQRSGTNIGSPVAGTGSAISFGNQTAADTYKVIAIKTGACTTTMSGNAVVTIIAAPVAPVGQSGSICGAGNVVISATPGSNEMISWYAAATGGNLLANSSSFTTPYITATTKYYAQSTSNATGCSSVRTGVNALVLYKSPGITGISGGNQFPCGVSKTLTYSVTASTGVTYTWTAPANAGIISGQGTGSVTITFDPAFTTGDITVKGINACGESATRSFTVSCSLQPIASGKGSAKAAIVADNNAAGVKVSAYPNPAKGQFTMEVKGYKAGRSNIVLTTATGAIVQSKSVELTTGSQNIPFNVTKEAPGMYFVKIITAEGTQVVKVILQ